MPEQCPHSVSDQDQIPTLTDQQWTEFVSDAHAMRQAETTLEAGMADLLARPFDESAQLQLRQVLDSVGTEEAAAAGNERAGGAADAGPNQGQRPGVQASGGGRLWRHRAGAAVRV